MTTESFWQPPDFSRPDSGRLGQIKAIASEVYPADEYGDLAAKISPYWISELENSWAAKSKDIKAKDLKYNPEDPLSRIAQKTVLIAYADSVREDGEATLITLEKFLKSHFPAIRGLHILPPCEISEERFNDGGFSQIRRDRIHAPYGSNAQFEAMMAKFYSMTDLVLNHVDIEHPKFQQYLNGDDRAGECFFLFSEVQYQKRLARGDFKQIFRPRPFPLFTIFRRKPPGPFADQSHEQRTAALNQRFQEHGLEPLPVAVIDLLYVFNKIKNDQMLLAEDYKYITQFQDHLKNTTAFKLKDLFVVSETQETQHIPYIFKADIQNKSDILAAVLPNIGILAAKAADYAAIYESADRELFGELIRALTTFSHVQVDLNTATYDGLKLLIEDFSWYLKMDLNMLRLDAANYGFKKWGTSCFGLPEVQKMLKILYLSMDCVSPRNVPNLEVNTPLSAVLKQMADKQAPPPMMYDFHLASMLPVVFNTGDACPLFEIFKMIGQYDVPRESIRFSLDESHDGKSVSGSGGADPLVTYAQRRDLIGVVTKNGGQVKYKSSTRHQYPLAEFQKVCIESGLDSATAVKSLFQNASHEAGILRLQETIQSPADIAQALKIDPYSIESDAALEFFTAKILNGKEPYELCITTRDVLTKLDNPILEAKRYLAFKTLALALMGRNFKAVYFNDLMGLKNDYELVEKTGELRNIKRTKADRHTLEHLIGDPSRVEYWIAKHTNNTIALVDSDPSFSPRGNEAQIVVDSNQPSIAIVHNSYQNHHTLIVVNTAGEAEQVQIQLPAYGLQIRKDLVDNITGRIISGPFGKDKITLELRPFERLWLKNTQVEIARDLLVEVGSEEDMQTALI